MPPRLSLSLDQNDGVLHSDQDVVGTVKITTDASIQVLHLRVVFYGHAQVYGAEPHTPLSNGIFDYLEDRQLINTGIRIARRPLLVEDTSIPIVESSKDAMKRSFLMKKLHNKPTDTTSSRKPAKTALVRETERLIRQIANKDQPKGALLLPELALFDYPPAHIYDLYNKQHKVRYRLSSPTTSRLLPGSFDHPHCPIRYYTIAILLCKELDTDKYYMAYVKLPIHYIPRISVLSATYAGLLRETDRLWLGNDSILARLLNSTHHYRHRHKNTAALVKNYSNPSFISVASSSSSSSLNGMPSSSFMTNWWYRLIQTHAWIRLDHAWIRLDRQVTYSKTLDCTLELPRRAFCRGQPLPFSVNLVNGAGIRIAMVAIEMKLVRRVVMTCSVAETIDSVIEWESTSTFYGDEVDASTQVSAVSATAAKKQPFFLFTTREMKFDLSGVVVIPDTCPCTIMPELTRNTFEMVYDWVVKVKVLETKQGPRLDASLDDDGQVTRYYASRAPANSVSPGTFSDYRTHVLEPPKMDIVIGNTEIKP
ncbi:hypothetical protein BC941DRAFT_498169 [Chlamydoabsidia padenii]|nr:hypothetical protein BC941DRAFT_498169 [Chlamydoabsidia padenii]